MRNYVTTLDDLALLITFKAKNGAVAAADMIEKAEEATVYQRRTQRQMRLSRKTR